MNNLEAFYWRDMNLIGQKARLNMFVTHFKAFARVLHQLILHYEVSK